jgi:hypothetical protein
MLDLHRRGQAIAALRNRFDDAMGGSIVPQVMTQFGDAVRHRLIGDHDVAPDLPVQHLARHDLASVLGQAHEHVHHPGLETHLRIAAHDPVLERLDEVLIDAEARLQLLTGERDRGHLDSRLTAATLSRCRTRPTYLP